jgi:hypothetical protein
VLLPLQEGTRLDLQGLLARRADNREKPHSLDKECQTNITPEDFASIVQGIHFNKTAQETRCCPDTFINCNIGDREPFDLQKGRLDSDKREEGPCVVLILESPHVDEFPKDDREPGPALGRTGDWIGRYLKEILLASHLKDRAMGCQGILLVNAIQFQCSLGEARGDGGGITRNLVFTATWEQGGRAGFIARLKKALIHEGDLLINACTAGRRKAPLWGLVEDAVCGARDGRSSDLRLYHPSTWGWAKWRQPPKDQRHSKN